MVAVSHPGEIRAVFHKPPLFTYVSDLVHIIYNGIDFIQFCGLSVGRCCEDSRGLNALLMQLFASTAGHHLGDFSGNDSKQQTYF